MKTGPSVRGRTSVCPGVPANPARFRASKVVPRAEGTFPSDPTAKPTTSTSSGRVLETMIFGA